MAGVKRPLTLEEIEQSDEIFLVATQVADVLGADPGTIREQAQANPYKLGFPVIVAGSRVKIPRIPFLKFIKGEFVYSQEEYKIKYENIERSENNAV